MTISPLTVVHPGRPGAFAWVIAHPEDGFAASPSATIPETAYPTIGDTVTVVSTRLTPVGNGQWRWVVIESPWVTRKTDQGHSFNPYDLDRYQHTFRVSALDVETGEPVNRFLDVKVQLAKDPA